MSRKNRRAAKKNIAAANKIAAISMLDEPISRLVGFDKKQSVKIEFEVLTPDIINAVPAALAADAKTRVRLYNRIMHEYNTAQQQQYDASAVNYHVPWNMLDFNEEFGREKRCDLNHVAKIVNNFVDHKYAIPRVVMMPIRDKNGEITDVKFWVADGWHRRTAKIELMYRENPTALRDSSDPITLQCSITPVKNVQEAAQCFASQNAPSERRTMVQSDNWRARVIARDTEVITVVNLARKHGFNAESPVNKNKQWPYFTSGDILLRMMFEFSDIGVDVVERVLGLLSDANNIGVFGKKQALDANFVGGLCHFIAIFERPGFAHALGVEYMLRQEGILDKVKDVTDSMSKEEQRRELPEKCFGSWSREENKRYLSRAAAFSVIYCRYVPPPNSKSGFWSKCPSNLRKLRHVSVAIDDPIERESYIANLQAQLASRGHLPIWPKYSTASTKSLTR
jgi:hypothetical protein